MAHQSETYDAFMRRRGVRNRRSWAAKARRVWAFLFGGNYPAHWGGTSWRPNLYRHVERYYREGWDEAGYTLRDWVFIHGRRVTHTRHR